MRRAGFQKWTMCASIFLALASCQTPPTVVKESPGRQVDLAASLNLPIVVTPTTVIVDARPLFEYSTFHIPHSIPMNWSDFTQHEYNQKGILLPDYGDIARRLARKGIGRDTHVVVVGQGIDGEGEEGRIAWMFSYLGMTNVQFAKFDSLKPRGTNIVESDLVPSVDDWTPNPLESLDVKRDEFVTAMKRSATKTPFAYGGQPAVLYRFIDVREARDYLNPATHIPSLDAINIPWKEFFDKSMHVRREIADKLKKVGVTPDQRIVVLSRDGVSSGAVTLALRSLHYGHAGNYSGGYNDLQSGF